MHAHCMRVSLCVCASHFRCSYCEISKPRFVSLCTQYKVNAKYTIFSPLFRSPFPTCPTISLSTRAVRSHHDILIVEMTKLSQAQFPNHNGKWVAKELNLPHLHKRDNMIHTAQCIGQRYIFIRNSTRARAHTHARVQCPPHACVFVFEKLGIIR